MSLSKPATTYLKRMSTQIHVERVTVRGDFLPQIDPNVEGILYRQRPGESDAVATEDRGNYVTWDDSADKFCREPARLTAQQAQNIVSQLSPRFSAVSFTFVFEQPTNN